MDESMIKMEVYDVCLIKPLKQESDEHKPTVLCFDEDLKSSTRLDTKSDIGNVMNDSMLQWTGNSYGGYSSRLDEMSEISLAHGNKMQAENKICPCLQCENCFKNVHDLQRHLRTHTGEKPSQCSMCNSAFRHASHLKDHMRTHTGEKPYQCSACDSAFSKA